LLQCTPQLGSFHSTVPFLFLFKYTNIMLLFPSADTFHHPQAVHCIQQV